jgi:hypothetical protein
MMPDLLNIPEWNTHIAMDDVLDGHKRFSGDMRLAHINQIPSVHPALNLNADFLTLQRLQ